MAQPGRTDSYRDITVVNLSNTRLYRHDRGFYFLEKVSQYITVYLGDAILIHINNICFYGEISKIINLYHFHFNPRLPLFLLYVRWKSGVTFVWRCFCEVCPKMLPRDRLERQVHSFFKNLPFKHFCLSSFFFNPENIIMLTHERMCLLGVSQGTVCA